MKPKTSLANTKNKNEYNKMNSVKTFSKRILYSLITDFLQKYMTATSTTACPKGIYKGTFPNL